MNALTELVCAAQASEGTWWQTSWSGVWRFGNDPIGAAIGSGRLM